MKLGWQHYGCPQDIVILLFAQGDGLADLRSRQSWLIPVLPDVFLSGEEYLRCTVDIESHSKLYS